MASPVYDAAAFGADRRQCWRPARPPARRRARCRARRPHRSASCSAATDGSQPRSVPLVAEDDAIACALLAARNRCARRPLFIDLADAKTEGGAPFAVRPLRHLRPQPGCAHLRGGWAAAFAPCARSRACSTAARRGDGPHSPMRDHSFGGLIGIFTVEELVGVGRLDVVGLLELEIRRPACSRRPCACRRASRGPRCARSRRSSGMVTRCQLSSSLS